MRYEDILIYENDEGVEFLNKSEADSYIKEIKDSLSTKIELRDKRIVELESAIAILKNTNLMQMYRLCVAESEKCSLKELDLNMRVSYGVLTDRDKYRFKTKYWNRYCCMWQKLGDKIKNNLDKIKG